MSDSWLEIMREVREAEFKLLSLYCEQEAEKKAEACKFNLSSINRLEVKVYYMGRLSNDELVCLRDGMRSNLNEAHDVNPLLQPQKAMKLASDAMEMMVDIVSELVDRETMRSTDG